MKNRTHHFAGLALCATASLALSACAGGQESVDVDLGSAAAEAGTVKEGALDGVTLTFVSYGGIYQDGQEAAAVKPFAEDSGAESSPTDPPTTRRSRPRSTPRTSPGTSSTPTRSGPRRTVASS